MNVLMISIDEKILLGQSAVAKRMIAYGNLVDNLYILIPTGQYRDSISLSTRVTVYPVYSRFKLWSRAKLYWATIGLAAKRISLVTVQDPFEQGLIGWLAARHLNAPLELQVHTDFLSPYFKAHFSNRIRVWLAKFLIPRADGIRVVSERIKGSLTAAGLKTKQPPLVLPIYLDGQTLKSVKPIFNSKQTVLLTVSRLTKEKRIDLIIKAFAGICRDIPDPVLIVVGEGPERRYLEQLARDLKVDRLIRFTGWRKNIADYYQADLFILVSKYEGYGLVLAEAAHFRLPIVATDVGIAREVGAVITEPTVPDLADNIIKVLTHPSRFQTKIDLIDQNQYLNHLQTFWYSHLK